MTLQEIKISFDPEMRLRVNDLIIREKLMDLYTDTVEAGKPY